MASKVSMRPVLSEGDVSGGGSLPEGPQTASDRKGRDWKPPSTPGEVCQWKLPPRQSLVLRPIADARVGRFGYRRRDARTTRSPYSSPQVHQAESGPLGNH